MTKVVLVQQHASVPTGAVFITEGRPLEVVKVYGADPAAPVVVVEKMAIGKALPGQYGLWCLAAVSAALNAPIGKKRR